MRRATVRRCRDTCIRKRVTYLEASCYKRYSDSEMMMYRADVEDNRKVYKKTSKPAESNLIVSRCTLRFRALTSRVEAATTEASAKEKMHRCAGV